MVKVLAILLLSAATVWADPPLCLGCHEAHYTEEFECVSCHGGRPDTSRKDIAHYRLIEGRYSYFLLDSYEVSRGGDIIEELRCRRCHIAGGKGNTLASSLDSTIKRLTAASIDDNITVPNDQMPQFNLLSRDSVYLVNALLSYANKIENKSMTEVAQLSDTKGADLFNGKCGGCHRLLSNKGALGLHTLAPFLSGLYSEYYPPLETGGKTLKWDEKLLSDWISNPRKVKPDTIMPVIKLTDKEKSEIIELFGEKK